jgi:glycosyltransferase involved in cell wall biosynthesis
LNKLKIIGICRLRNESHIIQDTLDHVSKFVDGIIILDDASTDNSLDICRKHEKVIGCITHTIWEPDPAKRAILEGSQRQQLYLKALEYNPQWIYYSDADEFAYNFPDLENSQADAYRFRLYDYYITEGDKNKNWKERKWLGPEYRDILMLFKPHPGIKFKSRVPTLPVHYRIETKGYVKHYGKAISVEEWEKTCKYYINHLNERGIRQKWLNRVGKAVHTKSDFGNELITWEEIKSKGIPLKE